MNLQKVGLSMISKFVVINDYTFALHCRASFHTFQRIVLNFHTSQKFAENNKNMNILYKNVQFRLSEISEIM